MYEYIQGKLEELAPAFAVIEAGNVGYLIHISLNSFSVLQGQTQTKLFIEEVIREDAHLLFGFSDKAERDLFRLLVSVSGVGANTANMILSSFSVAELEQVIAAGDVNAIKKVKGIGLKTAQRLIIDLKDKVKLSDSAASLASPVASQVKTEAIQALVMLGYVQAEASKIVEDIVSVQPTLELNQLIKEALRHNAKK